MSVREGVERDLAGLPEGLRLSGLAMVALAMADRVDAGRGSPSECGKVLMDALMRLRELAPPEREATRLDELKARRAARTVRRSAGSDL